MNAKRKDLRIVLPQITSAAGIPLYQQIVDGVKHELAAGRLQSGQPLPSFRKLAESLHVGLITVKRAYAELEVEGIIVRRQGQGTFIAHDADRRNQLAQLEHVKTLLRTAVQEGRLAGMQRIDIVNMVQGMIEEEEENNE